MLFEISLYLALAICLAGLLWRVHQWLSIDIGPEAPGSSGRRLAAAIRGILAAVFHRRLVSAGASLLGDTLLQLHLFKANPLRWVMHGLIFWGFLLLLLFHALDDEITLRLFPDYASTLNPFLLLRNLLGVMVLAGVLIALGRRLFIPAQKRVSGPMDIAILALLAAILLSGFLLEASQIVSHPIFDEMVADYHGSDDPEEVAALRAVWARDYHVVFDPPAAVSADLLTAGSDLNEESCAVCHSRPTAAFASLPLAVLIKPVAPRLNRLRADIWLWQVHYLLCFAGLALLPFTKFRHLVTTPLTLALRAVETHPPPDGKTASAAEPETVRLNRKTRRALALDGCTHCGVCSRHCSVAPSADILANPLILPSEKLLRLRQTTRHGLPAEEVDGDRFSEGSFICTECGRCTRICPSGLDLQDLWRAGRADLVRGRRPELHARAVQTPPEALLRALSTPPAATGAAPSAGPPAWAEANMGLSDDPATFQACVQCAVCSSVCPVVAAASEPDQDPEMGPHLVTNLLRLCQPDLAQAASMVWSCVTCYQCQESCPQQIRVADLLYELRNRSWARLRRTPSEEWHLGSAEVRS
jgi:heterodisulfide reductase subunit C/nitrate reductase gamma subunit